MYKRRLEVQVFLCTVPVGTSATCKYNFHTQFFAPRNERPAREFMIGFMMRQGEVSSVVTPQTRGGDRAECGERGHESWVQQG